MAPRLTALGPPGPQPSPDIPLPADAVTALLNCPPSPIPPAPVPLPVSCCTFQEGPSLHTSRAPRARSFA